MPIEKRQFTGGLDSDNEDRLVQQSNYRYALNVRASKSDGANAGAIENTKGNTLVDIPLPEGVNRILGAYDDLEHNLVFYFMFNNYGSHAIYKYDPVQNTVSVIIQASFLRFTSTSYINDARVIGDLLFFNDTVNQPRKINYVRAEANEYPNPLKEQYINAIVFAPSCPPKTEFFSDDNVKVNNVRGILRQFRTQYVYLDNELSAWSPISKTALPLDEDVYRPFDYYPTNLNNGIDITFDLGGDTVTKVRIAVREGNTGDFMLAEEIDKSKIPAGIIQSQEYTYKFYNDKAYTSLDNDGNSGMRLFDSLPLKADSQELIDGNRIAYAGITEFFNPVDVDIDIKVNRSTSKIISAPSIVKTIGVDAWNGYGVINTPDHWWFAGQDPDKHVRLIGTKPYKLDAITHQGSRLPSTPLFAGYWSNPLRTFSPYPIVHGNINDRAVIITNENTTTQITAGGSLVNEITIESPTGAGVRFVLSLSLTWWDLGLSDVKITETFKVQYTSIAGDNSYHVGVALRNKLNGLAPIKRGKVAINFQNSKVGQWSRGLSANVPTGFHSFEIWAEGYVPSADTTNPGYTPGVRKNWDVAVGGNIPALYGMTSGINTYADWTTQNRKTLKAGAKHSIGLVYYNEANQSGLTNTMVEKSFYVPYFAELNIPSGELPNQTSLTVDINHLPPSWATHYQVVYSGNQQAEKIPAAEGYLGFVQFQLKNVSVSSTAGSIACDISSIIDHNDETPEDIDLGYSFTKGDRLRLITKQITSSNYDFLQDSEYRDVEIISFDDLTNELVFKSPGITVGNNQLVEIYTPKKKVDSLVYKEIGECHKIINGFHQGDTNQTSLTSAVLELEDIGDVYLRYRTAPISAQVESYAYSDFYKSDSSDEGRPNIVDDKIKEVKRPSTIRFSGVYVPETNINGLSDFGDLSFKEYDQRYGSIQRMHSEDKDLLILQDLKVGKVRIGQSTLYGNDGSAIATLKRENTVLSDIVYYSGEYGIGVNPESFAVYGNRKYFVDVARGSVLRLSADGVTPISEYAMHNYFNDTFKRILDKGGNYKVFGEFDVRFDEYVISIQEHVPTIPLEISEITENVPVKELSQRTFIAKEEVETSGEATPTKDLSAVSEEFQSLTQETEEVIIRDAELGNLDLGDADLADPIVEILEAGTTETISFSEFKKRWVTFYSYYPDYMVGNNIGFLSFKNGALYIHNENALYNNFYGIQHSSIIETVSNAEPSSIKFYSNIFTESTHPFSMEASNQFGQKTSLIVDDFIDDEGVFKAALLRDENTPNVNNPLFEGDEMRCHSLTIRLENNDTELVTMLSVGVGLNLSQLTNK